MVGESESRPREPNRDWGKIARLVLRVIYAVLVAYGWICALGALSIWLLAQVGEPQQESLIGAAIFGGLLASSLAVMLAMRREGLPILGVARDALVLAALPAWGLYYSHDADASCESACGAEIFRPLAEPEVWVFLALHVFVVVAYAVARRRPAPLPRAPELLVQGALITGLLMQVLLGIHFGPMVLAGAVLPIVLPAFSPVLAVLLYALALWPRLSRTAADLRALASAGGIVGVYAALHAIWFGQADGALRVFTRTCSWTLSQVPVTTLEADCHYLCTVAARGHPALVRPLRVGRRRGAPILVNRQLAVANAFEDLLHERWPALGRASRRTYDRLALPICNYLRPRWVSDVVYLMMKPAEWGFYLTLLLLDPGEPEGRIDGMYR